MNIWHLKTSYVMLVFVASILWHVAWGAGVLVGNWQWELRSPGEAVVLRNLGRCASNCGRSDSPMWCGGLGLERLPRPTSISNRDKVPGSKLSPSFGSHLSVCLFVWFCFCLNLLFSIIKNSFMHLHLKLWLNTLYWQERDGKIVRQCFDEESDGHGNHYTYTTVVSDAMHHKLLSEAKLCYNCRSCE